MFKYLVVHTRSYINMKFKITNITGKLPLFTMFLFTTVFISVFTVFGGAFRTVAKSASVFFVLCFFVSGPAHILCLNVASG
jgi:hypothetical protein